MSRSSRRTVIVAGVIGVALGVFAVLAAEQVDHYTSTDAFCGTTCHSMEAHVITDEAYITSVHRTSTSGVRAGCADCHIPPGLVPATWEHITAGIKDIISEVSHDFSDPEVWEAKRAEMAYQVRDTMLANDSVTCRKCHNEAQITPERKRGQSQHADALENGITCIACHYNLVHKEVEPRDSFLEQSGG